MPAWLDERWRNALAALEVKGRLRALRAPAGHDFCSNDVLGAAHIAPRLAPTASRLLRGHRDAWDRLEATLAEWHEAEAALVFSNGYMANLGLLQAVVGAGDVVFSDALNHASIIDGLRLSRAQRVIYQHGDLAHLREGLTQLRGRRAFIVTESLFGMDGDIAPLSAIAELARTADAALVVDEAHATGVFGPRGSGLVDAMGIRAQVVASVHTGGKALGVPGAYVVGSALLQRVLINHSRTLIYTTALPPVATEWWQAAVAATQMNDAGRARVRALSDRLRRRLSDAGMPHGGEAYIIQVPLGRDETATQVAARIQRAGFDVRAIRPPTVPEGTARLRISVHADHDERLIDELAGVIAAAIKELA